MRKQLRVLVQHCVNCSESPSRARCLKNGALILCSIYICMGGAGGFVSQAAMNLETEAPAAGASVIINHYHASSLDPGAELEEAFTGGLSGAGQDAPQAETGGRTEVPTVAAPPTSEYDNVAISRVSNYVNVRSDASTSGAVVGKIYNNCAATILETVDGEGGTWYRIQSGNVQGFIKAQYFITGTEAESVARQVGTSFARVTNTSSLRLREAPNLESRTLDVLTPDAEYEVIGEEGDFAKISVDNDLVGYVFKEYIHIRVEFNKAVTTDEENAKKAEEERLKKEADEAIKRLEEAKQEAAKESAAQNTKAPETTKAPQTTKAPATKAPETVKAPAPLFDGTIEANPAGGNGTTKAPETVEAPETTKAPESPKAPGTGKAPGSNAPGTDAGGGPGAGSGGSGAVANATRSAIVAYAKQFLGNPYVYGGTSLTDGADCSGFTQAVFAHFGIAIGRSSRDQAAKGREISVGDVQPGDLLFYASGNYINHVALYIGGGQIIHSSTERTGITTAPSNYRTPCKAVTFLD